MSSSPASSSKSISPGKTLRKKLSFPKKNKDKKLLSSTAASVLTSAVNLSPVREDHHENDDYFGFHQGNNMHYMDTDNIYDGGANDGEQDHRLYARQFAQHEFNTGVRRDAAGMAAAIAPVPAGGVRGIHDFDADYVEHVQLKQQQQHQQQQQYLNNQRQHYDMRPINSKQSDRARIKALVNSIEFSPPPLPHNTADDYAMDEQTTYRNRRSSNEGGIPGRGGGSGTQGLSRSMNSEFRDSSRSKRRGNGHENDSGSYGSDSNLRSRDISEYDSSNMALWGSGDNLNFHRGPSEGSGLPEDNIHNLAGASCNFRSISAGGDSLEHDYANEHHAMVDAAYANANANSNDAASDYNESTKPKIDGNNSPLPIDGEIDLLQQAIQRRLMLHNRLAAMEAAKEEYAKSGEWDSANRSSSNGRGRRFGRRSTPGEDSISGREKRREERMMMQESLRGKDSEGNTLSGISEEYPEERKYQNASMRHPPQDTTGSFKDDPPRIRSIREVQSSPGSSQSNSPKMRLKVKKKSNQQMKINKFDTISQKIKRDAIEFMNYESKYSDDSHNQKHELAEEAQDGQHMDMIMDTEMEYRRKAGGRIMPIGDGNRDARGTENNENDGADQEAKDNESRIDDSGDEDFQDARSHEDGTETLFFDAQDDERVFNDPSPYNDFPNNNIINNNNRLENPLGENDHIQYSFSAPSGPQRQNEESSALSSDQDDDGDEGPTPQQIAKYTNMIRLGIPDVAILRSMEREEVSNPRQVLDSLKSESYKHESEGTTAYQTGLSQKDRQDIWTRKDSQSSVRSTTKESSNADRDDGEDNNDENVPNSQPLRDHPIYTKYFKMLKAKVPRSWVKRVLEVDGKDARILDLDPDKPLEEQVAGAGVDEDGNIDWDNVTLFRTVSSASSMESDSGAGSSKIVSAQKPAVPALPPAPTSSATVTKSDEDELTTPKIPADTAAAVRAELAEMAAKVGRSSRASSPSTNLPTSSIPDYNVESQLDEEVTTSNNSSGDTLFTSSRPPRPPNLTTDKRSVMKADLNSAVFAASNARLDRLRALNATNINSSSEGEEFGINIGHRRQNVDEIRRRTPLQPTSTKKSAQTSTSSSIASNEKRNTGRKQSHDHLLLKDDPRFAKYFQMLRSRVPRSWVERVMEVDDRDPAILDLDPNKTLASQIGDVDTVDESDTLESASAAQSLDESGITSTLPLEKDTSTEPKEETSTTASENDQDDDKSEPHEINEPDTQPPITQIRETDQDDDQSVTSSITSFRETNNIDNSRGDLSAKISAFLQRMDSRTRSHGDASAPGSEGKEPLRILSDEDIENRVTQLMQRFGTGEKASIGSTTETYEGQLELIEKSKSDISKLSSLLAAKLGQSTEMPEGSVEWQSSRPLSTEQQPELAKLSTLLTQVLSKMEQEQSKEETPEASKTLTKLPVPSKNPALEALFAKRAALAEEPVPIKDDPEYQKYFKMKKVGLPIQSIKQALVRDGKDPAIADMDPEKPYSNLAKGDNAVDPAASDKDPHSDDNITPNNSTLEALFAKRSATVGNKEISKTPKNKNAALEALFAKRASAMEQGVASKTTNNKNAALEALFAKRARPIDEKEIPIKDDSEYQKYFKMLKVGLPIGSVKQALMRDGKDPSIADMDPEKSYASQAESSEEVNNSQATKNDVPLKESEEYGKFFKMLKMGIPMGAVRQALQKEGKDPGIIELDPEKSLSSQIDNTPLKDSEEYGKFFKMLKMGIPKGAVRQALQKEGKDPNIIDMDPEKPISKQGNKPKNSQKVAAKQIAPKVARKRLFWNTIDESKLKENTFWSQAQEQTSLQLVGLDVDNEEFASLFTSPVNKSPSPKKETAPDVKKPLAKQKIQLIDSRRRMNGSILLTKFKVDYKALAKQVDSMEYVKAEGNELRGMMQLLPTKDEALALRSYLPPIDAPQSEIDDAIAKLGECEQYMAVMLDVPDAKDKFQCMVFRAEFEQHTETIRNGTKLLIEACDSVRNSERFRKVLVYALKLGNALNTGGASEEVKAITLDSLLKLAEAKAFDRQTSVLHYLVSIVQKNDEDVLKLSEDFVTVKVAERVAVDMLNQQLKEMKNGIKHVKKTALKFTPNPTCPMDEAPDTPEDDLLELSQMGKFSLSAEAKIKSLSNEFDNAKSNFSDLLDFFGEDSTMSPEAFFSTINSFVSMFNQTRDELRRKEEAKARRKRIEEAKAKNLAAKRSKQ